MLAFRFDCYLQLHFQQSQKVTKKIITEKYDRKVSQKNITEKYDRKVPQKNITDSITERITERITEKLTKRITENYPDQHHAQLLLLIYDTAAAVKRRLFLETV